MRNLRDSVSAATARREYTAALGQLAQLRPAVDGFFDEVMVNAEDPKLRANRLSLLAGLRGLFSGIADLRGCQANTRERDERPGRKRQTLSTGRRADRMKPARCE